MAIAGSPHTKKLHTETSGFPSTTTIFCSTYCFPHKSHILTRVESIQSHRKRVNELRWPSRTLCSTISVVLFTTTRVRSTRCELIAHDRRTRTRSHRVPRARNFVCHCHSRRRLGKRSNRSGGIRKGRERVSLAETMRPHIRGKGFHPLRAPYVEHTSKSFVAHR